MSEAVKLVKVYANRAWIECDWLGDAHVFVQSEAPNSEPVKVCTVFYDYLYADNGTKRDIARAIASRYDSRPIEERASSIPLPAPPKEDERG